ncbi:MAG: ATP-binding protein [Firmicutes bacterium]|nr:ATP-binding protein [Bacillota bacterium]
MKTLTFYISNFAVGAFVGYISSLIFGYWGWLAGSVILIGGISLIEFVIKSSKIDADEDDGIIPLSKWSLGELQKECAERNIKDFSTMTKDELIYAIFNDDFENNYTIEQMHDWFKEIGIETKGLTKQELIELNRQLDIDDDDIDYDDNEFDDTTEKPKQIHSKRHITKLTTKSNDSAIPTTKLSDIAGLDEAKKALEERIILPLKHKELYDKYDKSVGGGILLFGLPGTGKTMFAQAAATELDAKFFSVKCSDIESKWIGESENNVKKLFSDAKKCEKAIIFFDEFDSIGKRRSADNGYSNTVQEILTQMQGVEKNTNMLLVIAATNCPWALDGALLRPGRFSEKIYIPPPDEQARLFILNKNLKKYPLAHKVSIEKIADRLNGFSGADITEFCEKVKMLLIRKEIANQKPIITFDEIESLLMAVKSSILESDIENMNKFLNIG